MSSADDDAIKRSCREFLELMPLTQAIAGLPVNNSSRSLTHEQMEARAQTLVNAFKLAKQTLREAIKS